MCSPLPAAAQSALCSSSCRDDAAFFARSPRKAGRRGSGGGMAIRSHCSHSMSDDDDDDEEEEEEEVDFPSSSPSPSSFSAGLTFHVPSNTRIIEHEPSSSTYLVSLRSRQWLSRSLTVSVLKRNLLACSSSDEALTPSSETTVSEEQHCFFFFRFFGFLIGEGVERERVREQERERSDKRREGGIKEEEPGRKLRCEVDKKAGKNSCFLLSRRKQGCPRPGFDRKTGKMSARCRFRSQPFLSALPKGCDRVRGRPSGREREGIGRAEKPLVQARTMRGY